MTESKLSAGASDNGSERHYRKTPPLYNDSVSDGSLSLAKLQPHLCSPATMPVKFVAAARVGGLGRRP